MGDAGCAGAVATGLVGLALVGCCLVLHAVGVDGGGEVFDLGCVVEEFFVGERVGTFGVKILEFCSEFR